MLRLRARSFILGFCVGLLLCIGLNLLVAHVGSDCGLMGLLGLAGCSDDISRAGFPLPFWEEGGFAYRRDFNPAALVVDIISGLGAGVIAGWVWARYRVKQREGG
jgi:ABC-type antimicrobial peptide transport system permease subunit